MGKTNPDPKAKGTPFCKKSQNGNPKQTSIYVIAGKDESLLNMRCSQLIEQLLEPEQRAVGLFNAEPDKVNISELFDELRTLPFLTEKRVVLVKNADNFISENRDSLEKYFDNPCPTGILLLTVSNWNAKTKLAKKLPAVGQLISATQPSNKQLPDRLISYARDAHGKKLTPSAAEILIDLVSDRLPQLYSEIDKLALYADNEKAITAEHIEKLTGHNRLFNCFDVIDSCLSGDAARAAERLRAMFAEDKSAEYTAVGAFAYHLRRMFNARVMLEKGVNPGQIAAKLRIWSNKDAFFRQLRKLSLKQIGSYLQRLAATDHAIKTGRTTPASAMERLVLKLATE
ncbi:DNA polymerase III subunit delta [Planctomycetota bacterium]